MTILVVICTLPFFIPFLFDLNSTTQHLYCNSLLYLKCYSKISYFVLSGFLVLSAFPFSCWYTLFWYCCNNKLIQYCSILWSYLLILVAFACSLCFSFSRTSYNPFFLTLYLCSITLYFSFLLICPCFLCSELLICFHRSCIDCYILLFHQGSFTAFALLWFGLRPTFLPSRMTHALINLLVLVILSDLISFRIVFTFLVQSL